MAAVVVEFGSGRALRRCLESLVTAGVDRIVVVDNAGGLPLGPMRGMPEALVIRAPDNRGYGAGANLGVAAIGAAPEFVLVCNPDLVVGPGSVESLVATLDAHRDAAVAGPRLSEVGGAVYASGRRFPSVGESIGHGFLGHRWPDNPWTRRYRVSGDDQLRSREADWVSGACLLVRTDAYLAVAGFDEGYFMYVEDVDLCWRLRRAGWVVRYDADAVVVHEQGRSTSQRPYRMLAAHHRSMWRFARRSSSGAARLALPVVGVGILVRFALALMEQLGARRRGGTPGSH